MGTPQRVLNMANIASVLGHLRAPGELRITRLCAPTPRLGWPCSRHRHKLDVAGDAHRPELLGLNSLIRWPEEMPTLQARMLPSDVDLNLQKAFPCCLSGLGECPLQINPPRPMKNPPVLPSTSVPRWQHRDSWTLEAWVSIAPWHVSTAIRTPPSRRCPPGPKTPKLPRSSATCLESSTWHSQQRLTTTQLQR